MSISFRSETTTLADTDARETINGQDVHFAAITNTRYPGKQHDRASARAIGNTPSGEFESIITETFKRARDAAKAQPKTSAKSNSTMTMLLYDPHTYTIAVGSKGDSPAYVKLSDGQHHYMIRISSNRHSRGNMLITDLFDDYNPSSGTYSFKTKNGAADHDNPTHKGLIHLDQLIADAKKHLTFNKDAPIHVSAVLTTDGADPALQPDPTGMKDLVNGKPMANALHERAEDNMAQRIVKQALAMGGNDNTTALVLDDLQPNKGSSVALAVCDGFGTYGYQASEAAITMFVRHMREVARNFENTPREPYKPPVAAQTHMTVTELKAGIHMHAIGFGQVF